VIETFKVSTYVRYEVVVGYWKYVVRCGKTGVESKVLTFLFGIIKLGKSYVFSNIGQIISDQCNNLLTYSIFRLT